jgi:hypothetical protein
MTEEPYLEEVASGYEERGLLVLVLGTLLCQRGQGFQTQLADL